MKVLITGATGLIGSEIVELCHRKNIVVHYLTTRGDKIVSEDNFKGFLWNPNNNQIDLECFKGVTAIINLAGSSISKRWTESYKKEILSSRINSSRTLYNALQKVEHKNIKSFVSASAIGIYPNSADSLYIEDEPSVDDSFLGNVVRQWENEVDNFYKLKFKVAKIRIGLVMSSKGGALVEMAKPIKNYLGSAFGSGEQWQSWIHINDLARIVLFTIENELDGVYNGVAPNPVTNTKLVKELAKALNKPLILPNIPKFPMKLILGEMAYLLFVSQRVSSKKIEEEGFTFNYQNICKALDGIYNQTEETDLIDSLYKSEYIS